MHLSVLDKRQHAWEEAMNPDLAIACRYVYLVMVSVGDLGPYINSALSLCEHA